jgi:carbon-monoxide dehydrogenase iron sulfur subunit
VKGMLSIDVARCTACKTCELECAMAHSVAGDLEAIVETGEKAQRRIVVEPAGTFAVPLQCRHCEEAPCIAVCPTKAMHRNGAGFPVLVDESTCIGCRACIAVCPFGVIFMGLQGPAVVKCDLCIKRLAKGQEPACAAGCPTKAITFTTAEQASAETRHAAAERFLVAIERSSTAEKG